MARKKKTLKIDKVFCKKNEQPYDSIPWGTRTVQLVGKDGKDIFRQDGVEIPIPWSERAGFIVASKYLRGNLGTPQREHSVKQLFDRVVDTIGAAGVEQGYFDQRNAKIFMNELKWLLVNQKMAFNSPVFFNVGAEEQPQGSACFILGLEDDLKSILDLQVAEGLLFSNGSGAGSNLSLLRSAGERLSKGGQASGPISFLRAYDAWAGVIQSGGVQRRASKMIRLDDSHPDIWNGKNNGTDFVTFKSHEEKKAWALIDAGYSGEFRGEAYQSISGQNANLSVGLSDDFMRAVLKSEKWGTKYIKTGELAKSFKSEDMLNAIAEGAWMCGDPGVQFDDRINEWHTCPKSGKIYTSNPCGEFLFINDSACNLASLNLLSFIVPQERIFYELMFAQAIRVTLIAQEILVSMSGYPTEKITENSNKFRPLGLGYCNLGGMLMAMGIPYDSDEGRLWASGITAYMTGLAYQTSSDMAEVVGPFEGYEPNKRSMQKILRKHRSAVDDLNAERQDPELANIIEKSQQLWNSLTATGGPGYRNAQVTLVAPTGTIAHLMDSATQGVEPEMMLVYNKDLESGGTIRIMNNVVPQALESLGYEEAERDTILEKLIETKNSEKAGIKEHHLSVFDTAYPSSDSTRHISVNGHLKMLSAVQPFISGAISKTVGLPRSTTAREIKDVIISGWKLGLKSLTVYRSGSKRIQPITDGTCTAPVTAHHMRLPETRMSLTHKFDIGGQEGFITLGFYDDGKLGEVFLTLAKEGTTVNGFAAVLGRVISAGLQRNVPIDVYIEQMVNSKFDPRGFTKNKKIRSCQSIADYLAKYLERYKNPGALARTNHTDEINIQDILEQAENGEPAMGNEELYPSFEVCPNCGNLARRKGACLDCAHCGFSGSCG